MDGSAQRSDGPDTASWDDARQAVMAHVAACSAALARLSLRGDRAAAAELHIQNVLLRDLRDRLTQMCDREFNEAVVEAERDRAAADALAAAGIPQPRPPHLHAV